MSGSDESPIVLCTPKGVVQAGNIAGLVGHLLCAHSGETGEDRVYLDNFFTTFSAFSSDTEVYYALIRQFRDAPDKIKLSVLVVLKHWFTLPNVQIKTAVLRQTQTFALSVRSSPMITRVSGELAEIASQKIITIQYEYKPYSLDFLVAAFPKSSSITPQGLASALTALQGQAYSRILPSDYINSLRESDNNRLDAASEIYNRVVFWVKQTVLKPDTFEARIAALGFLVHTAQCCRMLRNFESLSAILDGLQSRVISRLSLSLKEMGKESKRVFSELGRLLEPGSSHRAYWSILKASDAPAVPWIAAHLEKLHNAWRQDLSTVSINGRELINFSEYARLAVLVKGCLSYTPPLLSDDVAGPLAYLKRELAGVIVNSFTEEQLNDRSLAREASEKSIRYWKILERKTLFRFRG